MRQETQLHLAGDLIASAVSATIVTPAVTIIDRALVEKASCNWPILRGLRSHGLDALKRPGRFVFSRPFGLIWTLYAATYAVANGADTITKETIPTSPARDPIVFGSTFAINVPLGVWKDMRFAQLFSKEATVALRNVPTRAFSNFGTAIFLLRDGITISGSFTLPSYCAGVIPDSLATDQHSRTVITQIVVPVLSQLMATPVHLLGLDLYNRPKVAAVSERVTLMARHLPSATVLRCIRIIPAFGFGCHMELRGYFHSKIRLEHH
ncbi:hypothetical protein SI65_09921 [Aspergillus cristatus]|uniref:Uncharacterized protein n=1 Tax=Aspergillus cristatus TaxID=573508 RepID=A0A1E3B1C7_ASPCR|nr:hypothetical protein SI65_09921 [Aspergillus cristatus]